MVFRAVEGSIVMQGSVSGTDATPFAAQESNRAQIIHIDNPLVLLATGTATFIGKGEIVVTQEGIDIVISGTPHPDDVNNLNGLQNSVTIAGTGGNTVLIDGQIITVSGFREEFVDASGTLQTQIDAVEASDVDSVNSLGGAIIIDSEGSVFVTTVGQTITISGAEEGALVGTDGITIISGTNTITISAFRNEFVNASGSLSSEIDSDIATHTAITNAHHTKYTDIEAITATESVRFTMSGTLSAEIDSDITTHAANASSHHARYTKDENDALIGGVGLTVISGSDIITLNGHLRYTKDENDAIVAGSNITVISGSNVVTINSTATGSGGGTAIAGADGITVISGVPTEGEVTVSGFRTEFVSASGILSTQITSDIATHTAISNIHHSRYIDAEAISALEPTTSALTASGVATDANTVSVSGHLQSRIDAVEGSDVDSINTLIGDIVIISKGEVGVTVEGQNIVVSGTDHTINIDTVSDALVGTDGITVISGVPTESETTVSGFRTEFLNVSGTLQTNINTNTTDITVNEAEILTVSGHLQSEIDIVEAGDVDDVNSVVGSVIIEGVGEVFVTTASQTITISGTVHPADQDTVSDALIGTDGITVTSGSNTTTLTGFRTEFVNASGTLSTKITDDIAIHTAIINAHHAKYTDPEAINALEPTTSALAASGVATDANVVSVSGHLQSEIDAVEGSDVDDVNSVIGSVIIVGAGNVAATTASQTITVSGSTASGTFSESLTISGSPVLTGTMTTKSIIVENPNDTEDLTFFFTDKELTTARMQAVLVISGVSPSVTWTIRFDSDRDAIGTEVVVGGTETTSIGNGSEITSFNNPTISGDSWVWLETTATGSTAALNLLNVSMILHEGA